MQARQRLWLSSGSQCCKILAGRIPHFPKREKKKEKREWESENETELAVGVKLEFAT